MQNVHKQDKKNPVHGHSEVELPSFKMTTISIYVRGDREKPGVS